MEIKCPQCGRIFEVPDTKVSRSFKCVCKFTFRNEAILKSSQPASETTKNPPPSEFETSSYADETWDGDSNSESDISERDIDNYLSDLRQSRAEIKADESKYKDPEEKILPSNFASQDLEIEIDVPHSSEPMFEETSELRLDPADAEIYQPEIVEEKKLSFLDHVKLFFKSRTGHLSLITTGLVTLVVGVVYWIISPGPEQKPADPYLAELLKGSEEASGADEPPQESLKEAKEEVVIHQQVEVEPSEKVKLPETKKALPQKRPSKTTKTAARKESVNLESLSLHGYYERIVSAVNSPASLEDIEREAQFYEASFLANSVSLASKNRLKQDLDRRWETTKASSLARAQSVYFIGANNHLEAVKRLKNLQLTRSRDPFVFGFLGLAYENLKRPQLALNSYSQALTLQGNFPWVLSRSSRLAYVTKQHDLALKLSDRLSKAGPDFRQQAYYQMGLVYLDRKNFSAAEKNLDASIKAKEMYSSRYTLGQILLPKNPKKAEFNFMRAADLAQNPKEKRMAFFSLGQAQCKNKNHPAAASSFRKAVAEDPGFVKAWEEKAKCEIQLGLFESASKTYQYILKTKPQNADVWRMYASSLRQAKRSKPALAAAKRSLELKDSDEGHYELALIYLSLSRKSEAAYHAKRAFRMNPKNQRAKNLLASLE